MERGLSGSVIFIYSTLLLFAFLWMLYKHRQRKILMFIIVVFFYGLFTYYGKSVINIYRMATLGWAIYLLINGNSFIKLKNTHRLLLFFFSIFFIVSLYSSLAVNKGNAFTVLSQLSRYVVIISAFFILRRLYLRNQLRFKEINILFGQLLVLQIFLSIIKLILIRGPYEGVVGTITGVSGGGAGTSIPLLGLCWFALNSNMVFKNRNSIIFLIGLLFVGFMAGKRAIWLLFPIFFVIFGFLVSKKKYTKQTLYIIALSPVFMYLGLRISPTLNPENKIWGSFDPEYAWNYMMEYSAGKKKPTGMYIQQDESLVSSGEGRVGANKLMLDLMQGINYNKRWFGNGVDYVFAADYSQYRNSDYYFGVNHRGSLTGVFMFFLAIGFLGTIPFLIFNILLFSDAKYKRLRYVLMGLVLFDFIFYNATIIREPSLAILVIFLLFYSRMQYSSQGKFVGETLKLNLSTLKFIK